MDVLLPTRRLVLGTAGAALTAVGGLLLGSLPAAAAPPPSCANDTCTVTFSLSGAPESFTVPTGVTSISATVAGGSGGAGHEDNLGGGQPDPGGDGGKVAASVPVTSGESLTVVVGGKGTDGLPVGSTDPTAAGGYGGGASAVNLQNAGSDGAGGGGSFLFRGADVLVAAGGGGGGGYQAGGTGGAGGPGNDGSAGGPAGVGGGGGTAASGGVGGTAGGTSGSGPASGPSTFGTGGEGADNCPLGGGGGGGYYGGGSGGCQTPANLGYGGGGGGSGFLAAGITASSTGTNTGDGSVTLTYRLPADTSTTLSVAPASGATPSTDLTLTAHVSGATGTPEGTATFYDGTAELGTATLHAGVATLHTTLPAGLHHLHVTYHGASGYLGSESAVLGYAVAAPSTPSTPASSTPAGSASVSSTPPAATASSPLAATGTRTASLGLLGLGLLAAGSVLWLVGLRRYRSH